MEQSTSSHGPSAGKARKRKYVDMPFSEGVGELLAGVGQRGAYVSDTCSTARGFVRDGVALESLVAVASLGNYGKQRNNEERDLHTWLQGVFPVVEPYYLDVKLEMKDEKGVAEDTTLPVFIPWELEHGMWLASKEQFGVSFMGVDGHAGLAEFWAWAKTQPFGKAHEVLQKLWSCNLALMFLLPVLIHMDGAELFNKSEFYIWSWSVLGAIGSVWDIKMLIGVVPHKKVKCAKVRAAVFTVFAKFLKWVFDVWQEGEFPYRGMYGELLTGERAKRAGQPIAGWHRGAFLGSKHDGKARREVHLFKRNYAATFCCDCCLCVQLFKNAPAHLFYGDHSLDAIWVDTIISHEEYMASEACLSPMSEIPGFHKDTIFRDDLHDRWLGSARDDVASTCVDLQEYGELKGRSAEDQYNYLWSKCLKFCRKADLEKPYGGFSKSMLGRENKQIEPELSSRFKAMQVKTICKFLADFTWRRDKGDNVHNAMRSTLFWGLMQMTHVFDNAWCDGRWRLRQDEIENAQHAGRHYLLCYQWLSEESMRLKTHNFKMRPKRHYVDHTVRGLVNGLNPVAVMCDTDETYMCVVKRIGCKTHGKTAPLRTLQRYLIGLALRVRQRKTQNVLCLARKV